MKTYTIRYNKNHYRVCAADKNAAVEIRFDRKYNEWAVGYAPRDGWWQTLAEAKDAALSILSK